MLVYNNYPFKRETTSIQIQRGEGLDPVQLEATSDTFLKDSILQKLRFF